MAAAYLNVDRKWIFTILAMLESKFSIGTLNSVYVALSVAELGYKTFRSFQIGVCRHLGFHISQKCVICLEERFYTESHCLFADVILSYLYVTSLRILSSAAADILVDFHFIIILDQQNLRID